MQFLLGLAPLMENLGEEETDRFKQEILWAVGSYGKSKERRLIGLVSSCPVLWEIGHPFLGDKDVEETTWHHIAQGVNMTVTECKNMWEALINDFVTQMDLPAPRLKWKYEDEMEFYVPYLTQKRIESVKMPLKKEEALDITMEDPFSLQFEDEEETSPLELCQVECPGSPSGSSQLPAATAPLQQSSGPSAADTTLFEFFTNMARTTSTFPPQLQAHVKAEVFRAVNSAEVQLHSRLLQMDLDLQAGISSQQHASKERTSNRRR